ncbi:hypothetical protein BGX31_007522 [Mortierella sp. GBA43]|nr:hypothetical protein BGX31_007522 [Mortierella sp. GBA43]
MPIDTLPQSKPRVPPKPARLHRQLSEIKAPDTDDSDDDDDEDGDDDLEDHVYPPTLHRRASSPSIAIPGRRPPSSVPTSPTISPSSISSSISLERPRSYTLPHPQYPSLGQGASFITVIPEGCVDPTNLTEAERIKVENEDQLDQKTYGPGDHVPHIPVAPLITTHRSLADKEKTYSDKVEEIKRKLQEKATQPQNGLKQQGNEVDTIHSLQESLASYRSMQSGVKATISKVRELTFRSASVGSVLEFPPYLVAYQLTLIESAIFLMIPPAALLTHSPKSPHRTITASTDFFNYLTRLIEYSILLPQEASGRAQCLHYWVKVAVKLHELENFQTLKAVLSAFGTPPIKRLKRTWSFVPRRSMHKLETLSELMSETRNYGKYREMMASLNTGSGSPSSGATLSGQSTSAPGGKLDMLSLNGVTQGLSSLGFKAKPVRKPMVPFLGTFIMDSTYLLAAVKKCANAVPPISVPATSSLREKPASIASYSSSTTDVASIISSNGTLVGSEEDARIQETLIQDARIQELLQTLSAYQAGPKYSSQPPRSYIKSATKSHHHFRAPSLSNPLHRTSKYRASSMDRQIGANINHQSSYEEEEDDVSGNGLRPTQQLILHYLLTRPWIPEKMVDEMSVALEPSKNKAASSGNGTVSSMGSSRTSAGASSSSTTLTAPTTHSWPGAGGSSHVSLASTLQRGSTGSNNSGDGFQNGSGGSSRPTSVED